MKGSALGVQLDELPCAQDAAELSPAVQSILQSRRLPKRPHAAQKGVSSDQQKPQQRGQKGAWPSQNAPDHPGSAAVSQLRSTEDTAALLCSAGAGPTSLYFGPHHCTAAFQPDLGAQAVPAARLLCRRVLSIWLCLLPAPSLHTPPLPTPAAR